MKQRVKELVDQGNALFTARASTMQRWQSEAEQFYPERADFTVGASTGEDFAAHLMTSAPSIARRDLANQLSSMLRPRGKPWMSTYTGIESIDKDVDAARWLEWASGIQRRAMYDSSAKFQRGTKETDFDFISFGNAAIKVEFSLGNNSLLYRNFHLRDVAWAESATGDIDEVHHKSKHSARNLDALFPGKVSPAVKSLLAKDPNTDVCCRHIIMPADVYDLSGKDGRLGNQRLPWVSIYIEEEGETILEEMGLWDSPWVIPRWGTLSGNPCGYSMATMIAIPDARMLQRMTLSLLEAHEKAVTPPMLAVRDALRSDIAVYAGGITILDAEYDERLGEALRPLTQDFRGLSNGMDVVKKYEEAIKEAFYLNKINLPPMDGGDMTATEIRARIEEYIRAALPLFEPIEQEYNAPLCEKTFNLLLRNNAFGDMAVVPRILQGEEIKFKFESPLQEAVEKAKAVKFQETIGLTGAAMQLDPSLKDELDLRSAFRDAVKSNGVPANWLRSEEEAAALRAQAEQAAKMQQMMATVQGGAGAAQQVGDAAQAMNAGFSAQSPTAAPADMQAAA